MTTNKSFVWTFSHLSTTKHNKNKQKDIQNPYTHPSSNHVKQEGNDPSLSFVIKFKNVLVKCFIMTTKEAVFNKIRGCMTGSSLEYIFIFLASSSSMDLSRLTVKYLTSIWWIVFNFCSDSHLVNIVCTTNKFPIIPTCSQLYVE